MSVLGVNKEKPTVGSKTDCLFENGSLEEVLFVTIQSSPLVSVTLFVFL